MKIIRKIISPITPTLIWLPPVSLFIIMLFRMAFGYLIFQDFNIPVAADALITIILTVLFVLGLEKALGAEESVYSIKGAPKGLLLMLPLIILDILVNIILFIMNNGQPGNISLPSPELLFNFISNDIFKVSLVLGLPLGHLLRHINEKKSVTTYFVVSTIVYSLLVSFGTLILSENTKTLDIIIWILLSLGFGAVCTGVFTRTLTVWPVIIALFIGETAEDIIISGMSSTEYSQTPVLWIVFALLMIAWGVFIVRPSKFLLT